MVDEKSVKRALQEAGVEVYRTRPGEVHVAERVRLHIMDSHIRVLTTNGLRLRFTARCQGSDFPASAAEELHQRVRDRLGEKASARGYREFETRVETVKDPVDENKILDTWHEIVFERDLDSVEAGIAEIRWALEFEKFVRP